MATNEPMEKAIDGIARRLFAISAARVGADVTWDSGPESTRDPVREVFRRDARELIAGLGLVAVDPKLVEAVRAADEQAVRAQFRPLGMTPAEIARCDAQRAIATGHAEADEHVTEEERACALARLALADAVLAALEPKP